MTNSKESGATQQVIDYTRPHWGHTLDITGVEGQPGVLQGFLFASFPLARAKPTEGTRVKWEAEYGYVIGEITKCRWMGDPDDMYEVTVQVVERQDHDGNVLWTAEEAT